ncbi:MAG TPA: hypothetical protein VIY52_15180 [Streptosporangiaceae bacterium]
MTATGGPDLRRVLRGMLRDVPAPPAPLDAIVRRGNGIRVRRAGAAVGVLGVAAVIATIALSPSGSRQPVSPSTAPVQARPAAPGGVFAAGTANGHPWRLAVQDIADPGYSCLPAITINGTDADPVYPGPENSAAVALSSYPGTGFAFVQLPSYTGGLILNGRETLQAVAVNVCGFHYRLVGFAYPLAGHNRLTAANPAPASYAVPMPVVPMPVVYPSSSVSAGLAQTAGVWNNGGVTSAETAMGVVADGLTSGQNWEIMVSLGAGGDCYEFISAGVVSSPQMTACGPVSTPDGPETIMALPLGSPNPGSGAIGYALQVSPATAELDATLSNGSTHPVTLSVVAGRKYAAFAVGSSLRLTRLTWRNAAGRVFASTTRLPLYGYLQFQPRALLRMSSLTKVRECSRR